MPHSEKLSSLKNYLWPISRHERGLVFHMLGFMLLVWISVVPLLGIRDGVLLMGPNSGPEVLGYMKIAGTLPAGFIFIYVYTWLYRRFSQEKTIYILLTFFSALYLLFALVVFPSAPDISFSPSIIKEIMDGYPKIKWLFPLIGNWPLTIFFILNDLWIVFAITILFWQTADRFILSEEAKRFFPLFVIFGGLASILAEGIFDCIYSYSSYIQDEDDQWKFLIKSVLILNVTAALLSLGMYYKLRRYIQKIYPERGLIPPQDLRKPVLQSLAYITKSPYLVTICITLFAAFAIDELLAIIWKSEVRVATYGVLAYDRFIEHFEVWNGAILIIVGLAAKNLLERYGWSKMVIVTPLLSLLMTAFLFFVFWYSSMLLDASSLLSFDLHFFLALISAAQNIFIKAMFVCVYTPVKEMAYLPLDQNTRMQGKTAVDIVGVTAGQAVTGVTQELLLAFSEGDGITIVFPLLIAILVMSVIWVIKTLHLRKHYEKMFNLTLVKN